MELILVERGIVYRRVRDLVPNERNPKAHALGLLDASVDRFGFVEPIVEDGRSGKLISGHGRMETLLALEDRAADPPDGILLDDHGAWTAPVVVGWSSKSDVEAEAALVAVNRAGEVGGWDQSALVAILTELSEDPAGFVGVGFDESELVRLLADSDTTQGPGDGAGDDVSYTTKITAPHYQMTGVRPEPSELVDQSRALDLISRITAASIPEDVKAFLSAAAARHNRFRYDRIAEFYAHADAVTQRLMEESALVIIDFDDAIANGYVRLSSRLASLLDVERRERGDELVTFESAGELEEILR